MVTESAILWITAVAIGQAHSTRTATGINSNTTSPANKAIPASIANSTETIIPI